MRSTLCSSIPVAALAVLLLAGSAPAWNAAGHRVIASIAYDNLTPAARARVDDLIRRHPDYQSIFLRNAPADPAQRAREAFLAASVWPDQIRNDPRFYDDTQPGAIRTRPLPGFPDMGRHTNWHYTNLPFSQDGTRLQDAPRPNAVTELERLIGVLGRPPDDPSNPVYALPWFLHLTGDLHNPLHAAARFSRGLPQGDRGGNLVFVKGESVQPLHLFWDDLLGSNSRLDTVVSAGRDLVSEYRAKGPLEPLAGSPSRWADESFILAKSDVYAFAQTAGGTRENAAVLSAAYSENAARISRRRAVEAGLRIAFILSRDLK